MLATFKGNKTKAEPNFLAILIAYECCGSIFSLVQILFFFDLAYVNV